MMMRMYLRARLAPDDERGATLVIVVLSIVAIFSMLVLTVDVGGLLLRRRSLVNGADAAALAAGQTCVDTADNRDPAAVANTYANTNASGLNATGNPIVANQNCFAGMTAADKGDAGWVTVQYQTPQRLFFAGVLGFGNNQAVAGGATAAFGPASSGFAVPIVLESDRLQGACKVPDGIAKGDTCAFWFDPSLIGSSDYGYMNLAEWGWQVGQNCPNSGANDRRGWIAGGYPTILPLNGTPPGNSPTYVCNDSGKAASNWSDLHDISYDVTGDAAKSTRTFPVNNCNGQVDSSGTPTPCPATPYAYDIIGFSDLEVLHVWAGNDTRAIGTAGVQGQCNDKALGAGLSFNDTLDLAAFAQANCGAPSVVDNIPFDSFFQVTPKVGPTYVGCQVGTGFPACSGPYDYTYNAQTKILTWHHATSTTERISFNWSTNGSPGDCGIRASDPNAVCLVTEWRGFTTSTGGICLNCPSFGADNILLCDRTLATCPGQ